jgi:hypothetical protein
VVKELYLEPEPAVLVGLVYSFISRVHSSFPSGVWWTEEFGMKKSMDVQVALR